MVIGLKDFSGGLVWDTESRESKEESVPWDIYKRQCGISIAVVVPLDGKLEEIEFFSDLDGGPYSIEGLQAKLSASPITVGYNSLGWDHEVVRGVTGRAVPVYNELDLYLVIKEALKKEGVERWRRGEWSLDGVCSRLFNRHKTILEGEKAPTLAKNGRWGELVKYCYNDVLLTRQLAWHMSENGYVLWPDGRRVLNVWEVMNSELSRIRGAQAAVRAA